ncbi:hypothetical protein ACK8HX_12925 [Oryzobacter sp. R7]|uniref:hypothetical protein n=1 Tax=Oryzobacter faecalis TaxID=3388656 RepID=UPI00398CB4E6
MPWGAAAAGAAAALALIYGLKWLKEHSSHEEHAPAPHEPPPQPVDLGGDAGAPHG